MSLASTTFARELELAGRLARTAGENALELRGGDLEVEYKNGSEPVTIADRRASDLIVGGLKAAFPSDVVICEETTDAPERRLGDRVWFVDPVDGTRDFMDGHEGFCVLIGLLVGGAPVVGVVYHPPTKELIVAATSAGAWLLPTGRNPIRLRVSGQDQLAAARVATTTKNLRHLREGEAPILGIGSFDRVGAIGLKLALVAAGDRDIFFNPSTRSSLWDTCGPEVILTEAGGRLTNVRGEPLEYRGESLKHSLGLVASNSTLHPGAVARAAPLLG